MRAGTLMIRTPEGISFALPLAGPVARSLAWIVDMIAVGLLATAVATLVSLFGLLLPDMAQAVGVLLFFITQCGYGITSEWLWRGQTPGKRVFGLRVM